MSSSGKTSNYCARCGEKANLTCGNCNQVSYCAREHQKADWTNHRPACKPYKIVYSPACGRYLVSSRFLPAGSLVLRESPFVLGPKATSETVCITCHIPVIESNFHRCPGCQWPTCSPDCPMRAAHQEECEVLRRDVKKCGVPVQQGETPRYDLVLLLRCLLLRDKKPADWATVLAMESHAEKRKLDAEPHHVAAVRYFTEVCKVDLDIDTVHHVRGAIITNTINTQSSTGVTLRGLYSTVSLLNHSCRPNVNLRSDADHTLYIRTTVDVPKGEPFLFSYVPTTDPRWTRQSDLNDIYYFSCKCSRCSDPTELGTFFSSPKCSNCLQGLLTPNQNDTSWNCAKCQTEQDLKSITKNSNDLLEWVNNKKLVTKHLELFLKGVNEKCHGKHFVKMEAHKKALNFLKGNNSYEANCLKKGMWQEFLDILAVIEPGETRRRGICLLELATVVLSIHEKRLLKPIQTKEPTKAQKEDKVPSQRNDANLDRQELALKAKSLTRECQSILALEPPGSTEDKWIERAKGLGERVDRALGVPQGERAGE